MTPDSENDLYNIKYFKTVIVTGTLLLFYAKMTFLLMHEYDRDYLLPD